MHILVTGGAGFIGSHFVTHVVTETDNHVTTLDRMTYAGKRDNLEPVLDSERLTIVEGDITDSEAVSPVVRDVDVIVNFAAQSHVDRSIDDASAFVESNIGGVQTLLDAALEHGIERFVQISTDEVYGEIENGVFTEGDALSPRNPYAATKAGADHLIQSYATTYGIPFNIIRPSNNYGPRQHTEKLIPKTITNALTGTEIPVYGDGTNIREWTYVEDTVRAVLRVIQSGKRYEIYNVGSGSERENIEVVKSILNLTDAPESLITFVDDRPGHDKRYAVDTSKIEALGWSPSISFEDGLANTVSYYEDTLNC